MMFCCDKKKDKHLTEETANEFGVFCRHSNPEFDFKQLNDVPEDALIFTVKGLSGRTVGYGARNDRHPWLYRPITPGLTTGYSLFGVDLTADEIINEQYAILVEGAFDAMILYQEGIKNVVGGYGVRLTQCQAALLASLCPTVFVMYDADKAGVRAGYESIKMLRDMGTKVVIVSGHDKDPDEYILEHGADKVLKLCLDQLDNTESDQLQMRL